MLQRCVFLKVAGELLAVLILEASTYLVPQDSSQIPCGRRRFHGPVELIEFRIAPGVLLVPLEKQAFDLVPVLQRVIRDEWIGAHALSLLRTPGGDGFFLHLDVGVHTSLLEGYAVHIAKGVDAAPQR